MSLTIESLFTIGGVPTTGLVPSLRIWEVSGIVKTPVIGPVAMLDVGDGFYLYEFTIGSGYDSTKSYTAMVDGGVSLPPNERYQTMNYEPDAACSIAPADINAIADAVWDETAVAHMIPGSTGEMLNLTKADTTQIALNTVTLMNWVDELLKYERNRTKIDKVAKTLTVYDDDGITPFKVFYLRDSNNNLSVVEVCERDPV